jgi:hypothetical protein
MSEIYLSAKVFGKLRNEEIPSFTRAGSERVRRDSSVPRHLLYAPNGIVQKFGRSLCVDKWFGHSIHCLVHDQLHPTLFPSAHLVTASTIPVNLKTANSSPI